jgi:hypothetical protein
LAEEFNTERMVHIEHVDGHPANGNATHNIRAFQMEKRKVVDKLDEIIKAIEDYAPPWSS